MWKWIKFIKRLNTLFSKILNSQKVSFDFEFEFLNRVFPLVVSTWQYKSTFKEKYIAILKRREEKEVEEMIVHIFFNA